MRMRHLNYSTKLREAALVKLADKSSNVGALAKSPPADWSLERRLNYIEWAIAVINELPQTSAEAISTFYQRCDQAELQAYIDLGSERMAQDAAIRILERKTLRSGGTQAESDRLIKTIMSNTLKPRR